MTNFSGKPLLTGASGFVGRFVQQAARCVPLSLNGRDVDLRNANDVNEAIEQIRPEAVLHLAAQTFVPRSFEDPLETFEVNFLGTYNLLAEAREPALDDQLRPQIDGRDLQSSANATH